MLSEERLEKITETLIHSRIEIFDGEGLGWKEAGLHLVTGIGGPVGTSRKSKNEIMDEMRSHSMVISYLIRHSSEEDFNEKYFYRVKEVKYYKVLQLAEAELAAA